MIFQENTTPETGKVADLSNVGDHKTRRLIALLVLIPLLGLYVLVLAVFLAGKIGNEQLTASIAALTGLLGLASSIVGFYFAVEQEAETEA